MLECIGIEDETVLEAVVRKGVRVRVSLRAPKIMEAIRKYEGLVLKASKAGKPVL